MAILSNSKHEAFCQEYVRNKQNAKQAYIKAGYGIDGNSAEASASRLLSNVKVSERIEELKKQTEQAELVTREEVIEALKRIGMNAEASDQLAVARACWQDLGKTIAAFTDKVETKETGTFNIVMNEDEAGIE